MCARNSFNNGLHSTLCTCKQLLLPSTYFQGAVELLPAARELIARAVDSVAPVLLKSTSASAHVVGFAALAPPEQVGRL
jgi:hypothetical protein